MASNLIANEDGSITLECGCKIENLGNGKHLTISCDIHDTELQEEFIKPIKKTRMRESREI